MVWKGEDTWALYRVEAPQREKVTGFLRWDFPILHFPQREHRDIFLFKGGRVDLWQTELGGKWEFEADPCRKNHSILFTCLMGIAYFLSKGSGVGPR